MYLLYGLYFLKYGWRKYGGEKDKVSGGEKWRIIGLEGFCVGYGV